MDNNNSRIITNQNFTWKYDISEFAEFTKYFSSKDWKQVKSRALRAAGNQLKRETRKELKNKLPASAKRNPNYSDRMIDAIGFSKPRYKKGDSTAMVLRLHVIDTRKPNSQTFKAHFFEEGTNYTRTKHSYVDKLGRKYKAGQKRKGVKGLKYFETANRNTSDAENNMQQILMQHIHKINNKKMKK